MKNKRQSQNLRIAHGESLSYNDCVTAIYALTCYVAYTEKKPEIEIQKMVMEKFGLDSIRDFDIEDYNDMVLYLTNDCLDKHITMH